MKKIASIIGARPQFIKAAVLSRKIRSKEWSDIFQEVIIHTGQHYDINLSEIFFKEMNIPEPDYNLEIGSGNHGEMTGKMLIEIESLLLKIMPDIVIVYGDTNSTLAGALAASKLNILVAHIEAGLRSFNKKMPEEKNRILTDKISDFLFCPSKLSSDNLLNEGIKTGIFVTGDIMYDAYIYYKEKIMNMGYNFGKTLKKLDLSGKLKENEYFLLTLHRAENTDNPERLLTIVESINSSGKKGIYPIHPRTEKSLEMNKLKFNKNIIITKPIGYFEMQNLINNAEFVVTDSGGLQKEAYFAKKPCLTLRDETEWVETVKSGWNSLIPIKKDIIINSFNSVEGGIENKSFYGDGDASSKILLKIADSK